MVKHSKMTTEAPLSVVVAFFLAVHFIFQRGWTFVFLLHCPQLIINLGNAEENCALLFMLFFTRCLRKMMSYICFSTSHTHIMRIGDLNISATMEMRLSCLT